MKKNLEDKLAMLAFEDLSPEEAQALEQEALHDPEAKIALFEYRQMREGLRAMADIPEHQLSSERLRDAILTQGLKPKSRSGLGWLWMPAAACALAFSFVAIRNMRASAGFQQFGGGGNVAVAPEHREDSIFVQPESTTRFDAGKSQVAETFKAPSSTESSVAVESSSPTPVVRRTHRARHTVDVDALKAAVAAQFRDDIDSISSPVKEESGRVMALSSAPAPQAKESGMALRGGADAAATSAPQGSTKIILIDGSKDAATGAQRATEVESSSNVLVGG
jgi:hypothetical protein